MEAPDLNDASAVIGLLGEASDALRSIPTRSGCAVRLPAHGRLLATGDLHDNPFHFEKIVSYAALDASPDRHVVFHEMIHGDRLLNGMDFSYRMLCRVARLVVRYPGQVHPIIANHEMAQMTGQGVSKGAGNSVELFRDAVAYVFGDAAEEVDDAIGGFIRAMPLALLSERGVMCAHSLPATHMVEKFDLDVLDRELEADDYRGPTGSAYLMTWGRGFTETHLAHLAAHWKVQMFCLGHQHVETGIETMGPAVILNSDHDAGRVLPLDLADLPKPEETIMFAMPIRGIADPSDQSIG